MTILGNLGEHYGGDHVSDIEILALWDTGFNTLDIARYLKMPEAAVYNRLNKILENKWREQDWEESMPKVRA